MSGRMLAVLLVLGAMTGAACAPVAPDAGTDATADGDPTDDPADGSAEETGLIPSLEVKADGDSVLMTLHLTSALEEPVVLEFPSAQRSDFQALDENGTVVWTWSADKLFAQAMGTETVPPGGTMEWSGVWNAPAPGRYEAVARLVATNRHIELAVPFEVQ